MPGHIDAGVYAALVVSILFIIWLFFRGQKWKEWHQSLSIDHKNLTELQINTQTDLRVAKQKMLVTREELISMSDSLSSAREGLAKVFSQKKSSEVRLGMDAEVLTPFLDVFKHDPKYTKFIGDPLDFVVFDPDKEITFVEVKSGNSKLSPKQNKLKKLIEEGKVKFDLIRIKA